MSQPIQEKARIAFELLSYMFPEPPRRDEFNAVLLALKWIQDDKDPETIPSPLADKLETIQEVRMDEAREVYPDVKEVLECIHFSNISKNEDNMTITREYMTSLSMSERANLFIKLHPYESSNKVSIDSEIQTYIDLFYNDSNANEEEIINSALEAIKEGKTIKDIDVFVLETSTPDWQSLISWIKRDIKIITELDKSIINPSEENKHGLLHLIQKTQVKEIKRLFTLVWDSLKQFDTNHEESIEIAERKAIDSVTDEYKDHFNQNEPFSY